MITVRYYPSAHPSFVFDTRFVPAEHLVSYDYDTPMFAFLNSHLLPTDIVCVQCLFEVDYSATCITYRLDDEMIRDLPPFEPIPEDCLPF